MIPLKYNFKNLFARLTSTVMTVFGVGLVVLVFTVMMALAHGFTSTMKGSGDPLNLMILREGAQSETTSWVSEEQVKLIEALPGVAKNAVGVPLVSRERVAFINQLRRGAKTESDGSNLLVRGVTERAFELHPKVKLAEGRMFRPGLQELIVGRGVAERFQNCGLGETLRVGTNDWSIVGIFDAPDTTFGTELWGDLPVVQQAFFGGTSSSAVVARARDEAALAELKKTISEDDVRLKLAALAATEYYEKQTGMTVMQFYMLGIFVSVIMSVGAVFGAMNTMYAAVGARRREIATMRALGFKRRHILVSFVLESVALCLLAAGVGILLALPVNGYTTGTTNWNTFVEVAFAFRISKDIIIQGFVFAAVIGFVGGLFPAWNACRTQIATGLREV